MTLPVAISCYLRAAGGGWRKSKEGGRRFFFGWIDVSLRVMKIYFLLSSR